MSIGFAMYRFHRRFLCRLILLGRFGDVFIAPRFEPRDLWIGAFWKVTRARYFRDDSIVKVEVWICILPTLPLYVRWQPYEGDEVPF
jgi:hypothetical protein